MVLVDDTGTEIGVPFNLSFDVPTGQNPNESFGEFSGGMFMTSLLGKAAHGRLLFSGVNVSLGGGAAAFFTGSGCTGDVYVAARETMSILTIYGGGGDFYVADLGSTPTTFSYQSRRTHEGNCQSFASLFSSDPHFPAISVDLSFQPPFRIEVRQ